MDMWTRVVIPGMLLRVIVLGGKWKPLVDKSYFRVCLFRFIAGPITSIWCSKAIFWPWYVKDIPPKRSFVAFYMLEITNCQIVFPELAFPQVILVEINNILILHIMRCLLLTPSLAHPSLPHQMAAIRHSRATMPSRTDYHITPHICTARFSIPRHDKTPNL